MTLREMQERVILHRRDTGKKDQYGDPIFEYHVTYLHGAHRWYRTEITTTNVVAFNRIFFISECGWSCKQRVPTLHNLTEKDAYKQLIVECENKQLIAEYERRGEK